MSKHKHVLETVNQVTTISKELGIAHQTTEDEILDGRLIQVNGQNLINFGSCSYLGLEMDERLKRGAADAAMRYGTQFSSSRAYMSVTLYRTAEALLSEIFENPVILTPTVTLGHMAAIPVLIDENDVVITDSQVHESVQMGLLAVKTRGIPVEMVRHNNMEALEARIIALSSKHEKVWYMADGVYSMYGDFIPAREIVHLLNKYDNFYVYIDDSHGMSWAGKKGAGYVLSQVKLHPKMYLTTGLAKSFGACGGVLIFPDEQSRSLVRNCGKPMIFSGPIQPPMLGAICASARIHLSDEITGLQEELIMRLKHFQDVAARYDFPLIGGDLSPIFFVGLGKPQTGYSIVKRLMNLGFFANLSVFPSVSYKNTGLRIPVTRHITLEDIENLLHSVSEQLPEALAEAGSSFEDIYKSFKLDKHVFDKAKMV